MKRQITDSNRENLTDSDLESNLLKKTSITCNGSLIQKFLTVFLYKKLIFSKFKSAIIY